MCSSQRRSHLGASYWVCRRPRGSFSGIRLLLLSAKVLNVFKPPFFPQFLLPCHHTTSDHCQILLAALRSLRFTGDWILLLSVFLVCLQSCWYWIFISTPSLSLPPCFHHSNLGLLSRTKMKLPASTWFELLKILLKKAVPMLEPDGFPSGPFVH